MAGTEKQRKKPTGSSTGTTRKKPTGSAVRRADGTIDTRRLANQINSGSNGAQVEKPKKVKSTEHKELELWKVLVIASAIEAVVLNLPFGLIGIYMACKGKKDTNRKGTSCRAFRHWLRLNVAGAVIGLAATGAIIAIRSIYMS